MTRCTLTNKSWVIVLLACRTNCRLTRHCWPRYTQLHSAHALNLSIRTTKSVWTITIGGATEEQIGIEWEKFWRYRPCDWVSQLLKIADQYDFSEPFYLRLLILKASPQHVQCSTSIQVTRSCHGRHLAPVVTKMQQTAPNRILEIKNFGVITGMLCLNWLWPWSWLEAHDGLGL